MIPNHCESDFASLPSLLEERCLIPGIIRLYKNNFKNMADDKDLELRRDGQESEENEGEDNPEMTEASPSESGDEEDKQ